MRAALLCPGPSLRAYPGREGQGGFDLVIGVNRVATLHPVDVWACGDWPLIEQERGRVLGEPTLFVAASGAAQLRDHSPAGPWPFKTIEFEQLEQGGFATSAGPQWNLFSTTAALMFAGWVGATRIDCYGIDWRGTLDWDGTAAGGNRSPERWQLEKDLCQNVLLPWLGRRGVEIKRHV